MKMGDMWVTGSQWSWGGRWEFNSPQTLWVVIEAYTGREDSLVEEVTFELDLERYGWFHCKKNGWECTEHCRENSTRKAQAKVEPGLISWAHLDQWSDEAILRHMLGAREWAPERTTRLQIKYSQSWTEGRKHGWCHRCRYLQVWIKLSCVPIKLWNWRARVSRGVFLCSLIGGGVARRSAFADQLAPFLDKKALEGRECPRQSSENQRCRQSYLSDWTQGVRLVVPYLQEEYIGSSISITHISPFSG